MANRSKNRPRNLETTSAEAAAEARAQAEAYESLFASTPLELDNDEVMMIPPHPDFGMLDDDNIEAYEELLFERDENYEREPDIHVPEQRLRDANTGEETGIVLPADTQRGALKRPFRIKDAQGQVKLLKPPWSVKVVQAAIGETEYKRLRAGGKCAGDVWKIWGKQGIIARQRQVGDPKSIGSSVDLEAVPETDSE